MSAPESLLAQLYKAERENERLKAQLLAAKKNVKWMEKEFNNHLKGECNYAFTTGFLMAMVETHVEEMNKIFNR